MDEAEKLLSRWRQGLPRGGAKCEQALAMNCHAFGTPGQAHPAAIKDLIRAAQIIQDAEKKERQDDADNNADNGEGKQDDPRGAQPARD